jgi:hypothetical protein
MAGQLLRRGDLVEVRRPLEILATLDEQGARGGLPFMPEMASLCGQRFVVERRADRFCDTIDYTGTRRIADAVFLGDLRCKGSAHAGCQAECRFVWKEDWVRAVSPETAPASLPEASEVQALIDRTSRHLRYTVDVEGRAQERWRCQATELQRASEHVKTFDPRSYVREFTNGDVSFCHFLRVTGRAAAMEPMRKLGLLPEIHLPGTRDKAAVEPPLNLKPGELVQVKSKEEIAATLTRDGRHKGLWFDREMMPFCGGTYRVRQRITRFLDERDGRMIELKNDCVTLEEVFCSGELSLRRWFCARAIYSYWRECWLRRVDSPTTG